MLHRSFLPVGVVSAITFIMIAAAEAEDRGTWFKSLRMPGTGFSCCDISDCKRTEADWRGGQWWAVVNGSWTPIPREKELDKQSIDGDAYVCASPTRRVYCFVKPNFAS
jgi:hypothetical protein